MNASIHTARKLISSLALLVCVSATLAGCKSGGGGSNTAASSSTSPAPVVASVNSNAPTTPTPEPTPAPAPSTSVVPPVVAPVTAPPATVVASTNTPPKIVGTTTPTVVANNLYSFKPAASDANGDQLLFQVQNKPVWATFSTLTGQLSGTPTVANAGTFANIVISVSDGVATVAMPAFSIAVTKPVVNAATLSWTPPTQNTDGSALSDLAGFTVVYGTSQSALDQTVRIDSATASTWSMDSFPSGTYYFAVKAFTASGAESSLSGVVSKAFN